MGIWDRHYKFCVIIFSSKIQKIKHVWKMRWGWNKGLYSNCFIFIYTQITHIISKISQFFQLISIYCDHWIGKRGLLWIVFGFHFKQLYQNKFYLKKSFSSHVIFFELLRKSEVCFRNSRYCRKVPANLVS